MVRIRRVAASAILIAFGAGAIGIGVQGYNDVRDEIAVQQIVAGDDAPELKNGRLEAGEEIDTGTEARAFAERVALFSIVIGAALLLTGLGFLVLTRGGALGYVTLPKLGRNVRTASAAT